MIPDKNKYIRFYDSCIPVKGVQRGVIYDLQRDNLYFIPNSVIEMLTGNVNNKISSIYREYSSQESLIDKYLNYLFENELIFFTETPDSFPEISTNYIKPFFIDILFLEIDTFSLIKREVLENIDSIGAIQIVLLTHRKIDTKIMKSILEIIKNSKIQIISLVTKYDEKVVAESIQLQSVFPRLREMTFYEALENEPPNESIKYSLEDINQLMTKRISKMTDFILNLGGYLESLNYNLFYNRKVYIDDKGNIKHYFGEAKTYGNIEQDSIIDIITTDEYKELWKITKNQIDECKQCEFRYICPDNRTPIKKSGEKNSYFHETNCNYNPRTATWK
ncbi:grasp-with-spasm system SPASM domain peptide maturase [Leptobacterium sp. I13]|uniref:grasp-with-spasm system SPASM domain peptide maturase n=1 Tax=Leptobacterium meishanense TaxID=3128904 RepID=UPI0030EDB06D